MILTNLLNQTVLLQTGLRLPQTPANKTAVRINPSMHLCSKQALSSEPSSFGQRSKRGQIKTKTKATQARFQGHVQLFCSNRFWTKPQYLKVIYVGFDSSAKSIAIWLRMRMEADYGDLLLKGLCASKYKYVYIYINI